MNSRRTVRSRLVPNKLQEETAKEESKTLDDDDDETVVNQAANDDKQSEMQQTGVGWMKEGKIKLNDSIAVKFDDARSVSYTHLRAHET